MSSPNIQGTRPKQIVIIPKTEQPKQTLEVVADELARGILMGLVGRLDGAVGPYAFGFKPKTDIPDEELMTRVPAMVLELGREQLGDRVVHDLASSWLMTTDNIEQGHARGMSGERLFVVFRNSDDPELSGLAEAALSA
jgi:hypothetical protein